MPLLCVFIFLAAAITGCAPSSVKEDRTQPKGLLWPPPPATPKIQYMGTIMRPQDIGAGSGFFSRLSDILLGGKVEDIIKPYGLAVDNGGRLLVVDTGMKRVHIYDIKDEDYSFIEKAGKTTFESPIAVAVDADDNIYVTDSVLAKVFVFSSKGRFLTAFEAGARPTGIAVDKAGRRVYVSDTVAHNVRVHDLKGALLKTIGRFGSGPGEFNRPVDLFVDKTGDLYVTDTMNFRIEIFNPEGVFSASFGRHGDGSGDLGRPKGVSVDNDGNIYVVDAVFDTVQVFNRSGELLIGFGSLGSEPGAFWLPSGIFIDGKDKIYVADTFNRRVQIFEYLGDN